MFVPPTINASAVSVVYTVSVVVTAEVAIAIPLISVAPSRATDAPPRTHLSVTRGTCISPEHPSARLHSHTQLQHA